MNNLLIIKTSSLGDVIHAMPALSDIRKHRPDLAVDWIVEESFSVIPRLHQGVRQVLPVALRRWRKQLLSVNTWKEMKQLKQLLRQQGYDLTLDLQGLIKSAMIGGWVPGTTHAGYDWGSAREPLASFWYGERHNVPRQLHAVERNRRLAAQVLGYACNGNPDYGLNAPVRLPACVPNTPYAVLLHSTSQAAKLWPEDHWIQLGLLLREHGLGCVLPGGNDQERQRAARLAQAIPEAVAAPALPLDQMAALLGSARCVIGLDTGLTHLATAFHLPVVAIHTVTQPEKTGVFGSPLAVNCGGHGHVPSVTQVMNALTLPP